MTANKLIISYQNLQKYLNQELMISESLEDSIKGMRIGSFPKIDVFTIEEDLIKFKSKLKKANYFELHIQTLYNTKLNSFIGLNSDHKVKRLIIGKNKMHNQSSKFIIYNNSLETQR